MRSINGVPTYSQRQEFQSDIDLRQQFASRMKSLLPWLDDNDLYRYCDYVGTAMWKKKEEGYRYVGRLQWSDDLLRNSYEDFRAQYVRRLEQDTPL